MIVEFSDSDILLIPVLLSTVTPGKLPTFWFKPVRALKTELFPLFGLPTRAICRDGWFKGCKGNASLPCHPDASGRHLFVKPLMSGRHLRTRRLFCIFLL